MTKSRVFSILRACGISLVELYLGSFFTFFQWIITKKILCIFWKLLSNKWLLGTIYSFKISPLISHNSLAKCNDYQPKIANLGPFLFPRILHCKLQDWKYLQIPQDPARLVNRMYLWQSNKTQITLLSFTILLNYHLLTFTLILDGLLRRLWVQTLAKTNIFL